MKRFDETRKGYRFDKAIFWGAFGVLLFLAFYLLSEQGFNTSPYFYIKCEKDSCPNPLKDSTFTCKNEVRFLWMIPLYKDRACMRNCDQEWCSWENLPRGEYGKKPPVLLRYFGMVTFGILLTAMLLNHLTHNKGRKFDLELRISEKHRIGREELEKAFTKDENKDNRKE
jgi:hypothetical protein